MQEATLGIWTHSYEVELVAKRYEEKASGLSHVQAIQNDDYSQHWLSRSRDDGSTASLDSSQQAAHAGIFQVATSRTENTKKRC